MEDLKEELTTIYHDNYSEEEFVKEMGIFIRQREKDLLDELWHKIAEDLEHPKYCAFRDEKYKECARCYIDRKRLELFNE